MTKHAIAHSSPILRILRVLILIAALAFLLLIFGATSAEPQWAGHGKNRILVRVDPFDLHGRASDEMPTRIHITADEVHLRTHSDGKIDVGSFEIEQYDPQTGKPVPYGKWAYAHAAWELPYRWYDDTIPEEDRKSVV